MTLKRKILGLVTAMAIGVVSSSVLAGDIPQLKTGWNLVGIGVEPQSGETFDLSEIQNLSDIFTFKWKEFLGQYSLSMIGKSDIEDAGLEPGKGYWVKVDNDTEITFLLGNPEVKEIRPFVYKGWNLLAFSGSYGEFENAAKEKGYILSDIFTFKWKEFLGQYSLSMIGKSDIEDAGLDFSQGYWVKLDPLETFSPKSLRFANELASLENGTFVASVPSAELEANKQIDITFYVPHTDYCQPEYDNVTAEVSIDDASSKRSADLIFSGVVISVNCTSREVESVDVPQGAQLVVTGTDVNGTEFTKVVIEAKSDNSSLAETLQGCQQDENCLSVDLAKIEELIKGQVTEDHPLYQVSYPGNYTVEIHFTGIPADNVTANLEVTQ